MTTSETEHDLTEERLHALMRRAEQTICAPTDDRCYGFSAGVTQARWRGRPDGWCRIGWVCAEAGRTAWDAWENITTDEGRFTRWLETH